VVCVEVLWGASISLCGECLGAGLLPVLGVLGVVLVYLYTEHFLHYCPVVL